MVTPQSKTIERVLKLLALSKDKGATEAEATLALQKAQELMHDANLTMAELEANGQSSGEGGVREKSAMENRSPYKWHRDLMNQIAELNSVYCAIRMERRGGEYWKSATETFVGYTLIGRQANVASTRAMFEYLTATVERLGREWAGDKANWFTTDAFNFKRGCAERVIQRLAARHEENVAKQEREAREAKARQSHPAAATGTSIVVVMRDYYQSEVDLNNDMVRGWEPGTTSLRRLEAEARQQKVRYDNEQRRIAIRAQYPDVSDDVLWWMVAGYTYEQALKQVTPESEKSEKSETESQRRKREDRERRENNRYWEKHYRKNAYRNTEAYRAGQAAGDDVGLDAQVGKNDTKQIG